MNMLNVLKRSLTRTRDSRRKQVAGLVAIDALESRLLLTAPTLTDSEQYMLELVNRARANPEAEATRFGIGLNAGLPAGTISTEAKQPLAPQQQLTTAARAHSKDMLEKDFFSHLSSLGGITSSQRVTNAGYNWLSVEENIRFSAKTSEASQKVYIDEIHEALIRGSVDRTNIMDPQYEELGIGAELGSFKNPANQVTYQFTEMVTQDFGRRNLDPYITGVVYHDADSNDFYTIGESIRSGTVKAVNVSTGAVFSDTIGVSGAYGFVVPAGTYTVTATFTLDGATQNLVNPENVIVGIDNVKVDFQGGAGNSIPLALTLGSAVTTLNENGATATTTMTVTRNGSLASSLTVNVASTDMTEVTVPATVVIPAGQLSVTFTASAVNDGLIDGKQTANITTTASAFAGASRVLTVTDKTVPMLPSDIQTVATIRPTFKWTAVSNAATYEVHVYNVTTNKHDATSKKGIIGTSFTSTVNRPPGTYNVWVRGRTSAGLLSGWSPKATWIVSLTTTVLNSGRTESSGNFKISWNPVSGASTYDVKVDRLTSSTTDYLRNTSVIGTTLSVSNFDVGSYGIWVRARNTAGDLGGWSPQAIVNVNYATAAVSVIATDLKSTPSLRWLPVGGAALYEVQVNNLTTGVSDVVRNTAVEGTTLVLANLPAASYRAWVRGRDLAGGGFYVWSSAFNFEVGGAPRITSPTGNGQPLRPTITWTSVSGAARYEIWVANLTTGIREISDTNLLSNSYTPTTDLKQSNNYRVWIRAFDSSGAATTWSLPVTFTIASNSATSPDIKSPLSPIGDPVLERLFASADSWLYDQLDEVPPAAVPKNTDPVESNMPQEPNGQHVEHALIADFGGRFADDKTAI